MTPPMEPASAFIDQKIKELGDWRGKTLAKVRDITHIIYDLALSGD